MAHGRSKILQYLPEVVPKKVYDIERPDEKKVRKQQLQAARRQARARRAERT